MRMLSLLAFLTACSGDTTATPTATEAPVAVSDYTPSTEAPSDVAAPPEGAQSTPSGLKYALLKKGEGGALHPETESTVTVHYTGWTTDGKKFDSSRDRSSPATFALTQVIAGWTEGLQLMAKGDHYRFWIPEDLAYKGSPGKPAGMLVFDVELLEFVTPPKAPPAPSDVAEAPADATKTASGLAYKVIKKGPGGASPKPSSMAIVHYAGWTSDGNNFDFSRKRGTEPAAFGVGGVIPGWTEGLQLMEAGDHYRFWIPANLAYEGKNGPQGTLVFDVELQGVVEAPPLTAPTAAKTTPSGIKYVIEQPASAESKPVADAKLTMNWIGWTADGKGFDSNLGREPSHPMGQLRMIEGLKEAAYMLNKGEKGTFYIPESLAFKGRPGAPPGDIVYVLELIDWAPDPHAMIPKE